MPTKILHKENLIPGRTSKLVLDAPHIASTAKPGHFVMLRVNERGERFPLTIADTDAERGTITIVYLVMGKSTTLLEELGVGDDISDVCGPLGGPPTSSPSASRTRSSVWAAARAWPPCTISPRDIIRRETTS